jgi:hypothetical protein
MTRGLTGAVVYMFPPRILTRFWKDLRLNFTVEDRTVTYFYCPLQGFRDCFVKCPLLSCHLSVFIATSINWGLLSVAYSHIENYQPVSTFDGKFKTRTLLISLTGEAEIFIHSWLVVLVETFRLSAEENVNTCRSLPPLPTLVNKGQLSGANSSDLSVLDLLQENPLVQYGLEPDAWEAWIHRSFTKPGEALGKIDEELGGHALYKGST